MTPAPLQLGHAPSELALNRAGLTPLALANALRMGSSSPVYVAGLLRRDPLIAGLVDRHHPVPGGDGAADQRALPRPGHARDHDQHPERDVDVDVAQVVGARSPDLQRAGRGTHRRLDAGAIVEMPPGQRVTGPQPVHGALEDDLTAGRAGPGSEVDHMITDGDGLRLVLDHEHRVALVPQLQQQLVHPLDVVRVQADRRLVEHVRDVGEARSEMTDHLGALRLAAGQRARRALQTEVAQSDLDERVEGVAQGVEQRRHRRLVQIPHPHGKITDLHGAGVGDVDLADPRRPGLGAQPGAVTLRAQSRRSPLAPRTRGCAAASRPRPWTGRTSGSSGSDPCTSG